MKMKTGLLMEHQRRRNDAIDGEQHPLNNNHQIVVEPVVLMKVTVAVREAQGILFHTRMLRTARMKVSERNK
jgi:hypothetical protein